MLHRIMIWLGTLLSLVLIFGMTPARADLLQVLARPDAVFKSGLEISTCANGIIEDAEQCDDGNILNGDGCAANCRLIQCGDGAKEPAEECDDGTINLSDGCGGEFCEVQPGWICSPSMPELPSSTSICAAILNCGDGVVAAPEQCDDGDMDNDDGCNSSCLIESGFSCAGTPSVCQLNCGNGLLDVDEMCDGPNLNGQTCASQGFLTGALACNSECSFDLSACTLCGNGTIDPDEECDGGDFAGETCASQGFSSGPLACSATCSLDISACIGAVAPVAVNDVFDGTEDVVFNVPAASLATNDADANSDALTVTSVQNPTHGSVSLVDGTVTFFPDADFFGAASFEYTVSDGALTDTGLVTINFASENDVPVAVDDFAFTFQGEPIVIDVLANDSGLGDPPITVIIAFGSTNARDVAVFNNVVEYFPNFNFSGPDNLSYFIVDEDGDESSGTITVDVVPSTGFGTGSCCEEHFTPGCNNPSVVDVVCEVNSTCCTGFWSPFCVDTAIDFFGPGLCP